MRFPRAAGILLHPTSLPGSFGAGDLGPSAYHFVDWLASAGQRLWQVLPLGPIGLGNSPYMSVSAFAGNPLLVDLHELATHGWLLNEELSAHPSFPHQHVDYRATAAFREAKLRHAARRFFADAGSEHGDFNVFCTEQAFWLVDYALFMALAKHAGSADWTVWDRPLADRDPAALAAAERRFAGEIGFWKFVQWRFFRQWGALKRYANRHRVRIVGDVPIFISHHSADVWAHPQLFKLARTGQPSVVAGVPPDYFSATGQLWGNPLYDWRRIAAEDYRWWVARIASARELADYVRIDHFRGFAAAWEIPAGDRTAERGCWVQGPGEALFDTLAAALGALPIIAEDLGVITDDVVELRRRLDLPGMRILQFAFHADASHPYLPHNFDPNTVVYTGTHDNDATLGWYAAASERERDFARRYLSSDGREIHWDLIHAAFMSVADLAIVPLQDVLGLGAESRMNTPGRPSDCWTWRFTWDQVHHWQTERLTQLSALSGRADWSRLDLAN